PRSWRRLCGGNGSRPSGGSSARSTNGSAMTNRPEIHWDASASVARNASQKLPEMTRQFFAAGRAAATLDSSLQAMHRFRIQTKRFRYSLDLFRDYYGPALEQRIEALRGLQDRLGAISD